MNLIRNIWSEITLKTDYHISQGSNEETTILNIWHCLCKKLDDGSANNVMQNNNLISEAWYTNYGVYSNFASPAGCTVSCYKWQYYI